MNDEAGNPGKAAAAADPADDKLNAIRGQMLSSTNFYHASRLSAADNKASTLMAVAGVGIGFIAQRSAMETGSILEALSTVLYHPSLVALFATIVIAALAQRAVRVSGDDWLSHLVAGEPSEKVGEEFLAQDSRTLFVNWVSSQGILVRIAAHKYRLVNFATWMLLLGLGLAVAGL